MAGFVDLHCHWIAGIDDGARSVEEGAEMLRALRRAGFEHVVATPHMRPGMFDNDRVGIERAFERMLDALGPRERDAELPEVSLGSEHFFDGVVLERIRLGEAVPYRFAEGPTRAILIEFLDLAPLALVEQQLFKLQTEGYLPVIAHPERYRAVWNSAECLERLVELGSVALLDIAAVEGKYGRTAKKTAWELLERGVYDAACSDAHRPADVAIVARAVERVRDRYGNDEVELLLSQGPRAVLQGKRPGPDV